MAVATCLPSGVLSCVLSFCADDADEDVVELVGVALLDDWFEQPLTTATGVASRTAAVATCFNMSAAYPVDTRNKLRINGDHAATETLARRNRFAIKRTSPGCVPSGSVTTSAPLARSRS